MDGTQRVSAATIRRAPLLGILVLLLSWAHVGFPQAAAAGDINRAGCPSETEGSAGFRTYLPDCRAYELVSPPFKDGFPIEEIVARSGDGLRVIGTSLGGFEGTPVDNTEGGVFLGTSYEFSRSAAGWSTAPLAPPASLFAEGGLLAPSVDLERTLWKLRLSRPDAPLPARPEGEYDLYVREAEPPGGSCAAGEIAVPGACFAHVGPAQPPAAHPFFGEAETGNYVGESQDLTHVLIAQGSATEIPSAGLWPGDRTVEGRSLYEYSGVEQAEPKLVGVRNSGPVASNSEAELIGVCGMQLGGPGDRYNAMSAPSGSTVSFTANECFREAVPNEPKANELYARINGSQTVDISEPSVEDCAACSTSSPAPAFFQGASEDGKKVIFLSEQAELLPEATGENLYEYDFEAPAGEKLVRVSGGLAEPGVQGVVRVSEDGSHVYFVAAGVLASNENGDGETATTGADNLYVYEPDAAEPGRYHTVFVARLCSEAGESGAVSDPKCHGSDGKIWGREDERPAEATPDGRFLVFSSKAQLTSDDTSTVSQLFEYDAQTGSLTRISVGHNGYNDNGNTSSEGLAPFGPQTSYESIYFPAKTETRSMVSADGSYVFFTSADSLVEQAAPGVTSVYEYHAGNVFLVSSGQSTTEPAGLYGTDGSGHDVFFETPDRLVGQDTDSQLDVYDARLEGGFPAPVSPQSCSEDPCQGPLGGAPGLLPAGSATQPGGGNLPPGAPVTTAARPHAKSLTRAQKLAAALKACKKKPRRRRAACRARARRKYGAESQAANSGRARR